jgi:hypothetical protein
VTPPTHPRHPKLLRPPRKPLAPDLGRLGPRSATSTGPVREQGRGRGVGRVSALSVFAGVWCSARPVLSLTRIRRTGDLGSTEGRCELLAQYLNRLGPHGVIFADTGRGQRLEVGRVSGPRVFDDLGVCCHSATSPTIIRRPGHSAMSGVRRELLARDLGRSLGQLDPQGVMSAGVGRERRRGTRLGRVSALPVLHGLWCCGQPGTSLTGVRRSEHQRTGHVGLSPNARGVVSVSAALVRVEDQVCGTRTVVSEVGSELADA